MALVTFEIGKDTSEGVALNAGTIVATPTRRRVDGTVVVARNSVCTEFCREAVSLELPSTPLGVAMKIVIDSNHAEPIDGYFKIPNAESISFSELIEVDPETLETGTPEPEWWAIANATVNSGKVVGDHLILTRTDGVEVDAGNVRGLPGQDGKDGEDGKPGRNGLNGLDGKDGEDADTSKFVLKGFDVSNARHTLYVDSSASDDGDGGELTPFKTFSQAFEYLKNVEPVLQGYWEIFAKAGTYNIVGGGHSLTARSINRVVVRGEVDGDGVPTTIIDGAGGATYSHGLRAGGIGVRVEFKNLKFINFNNGGGDSTRIGCVGENESDVYFNNIHAENCSWTGIYAFNTIRARITGGRINACRAGIVANDTQCTVLDTVISNSTEDGIYWSRGSQGHVDYVTISGCPVGLRVSESSRVDTVGINFMRNAYAVRTRTGGVFGEGGAANIYNIGTVDANTVDKEYSANSGDSRELEKSQDSIRLSTIRNSIPHGVVGESLLANIMTLSPNRLTGTGKELKIEVYGVFTSVTADSRMYVDVGGSRATFVPKAGSNESFILTMNFLEASGGYRSFSKIEQGLNYSRISFGGSGFIRGVENTVNLLANLSSSGESLTIYKINVWVTG